MSQAFTRRYKLLDRIAVGGTAEVFRALSIADSGIETPVVIKRVLPQMAGDERFRKLFAEEAGLAAALSHPNIVRVLDHGDLGDTCYIALERIDGKDLGSLLNAVRQSSAQLPVPAPLAAMIAAEVGEALQFIHHHTSAEGLPLQIIHRDVSPQNILVSYRGDVKLTDFGIAKSVIRREHTVDGTLRGKLQYMAPEQANSDHTVDHRADLFALGCVLYEMLQGYSPLRGATDIETLDRVRECRFVLPPNHVGAPMALRSILVRLLQRDRRLRYPTASDLVADLRSYLVQSDPAPSRQTLAEWVQLWGDSPASDVGNQAVDQAVRALFGDAFDEAEDEPEYSDPSLPSEGTAAIPSADLVSPPNGAPQSLDLSGTGAPLRKRSTSVFASGAMPAVPQERTAEVQAPEDGPFRIEPGRADRRRTLRLMIPVAALGLLGWGMWALQLRNRPEAPRQVPQAGPTTRQPAPAPVDQPTVVRLGPPRWVQSDPAGASIRVNGKKRGVTPSLLRLPQQSFLLELRKRGYRIYQRRFEAGEPSAGLTAKLRPVASSRPARTVKRANGFLTVNSLPWSRVYLDGRFLGNTPVVRREVTAGRRQIQLRGPSGRLRKSFVANVRAGQTGTFTFDFRPTASEKKPRGLTSAP